MPVRIVRCLGLVLGFSLALAQSLTSQQFRTFTYRDVGFVCESSPLRGGKPRQLCSSPNGLATLELIGPSRDLESANLLVFITDDPAQQALSTAYLFGFITIVYPNWEGAGAWLGSTISRANEAEGAVVRGRRGGYVLEVTSHLSVLGSLLVTIKPW